MSRARTLDIARYAETFAVLVSRSTEYAPMNTYLCQLGQARLLDGFSMLDVGAGTGMVIEDWLAAGGARPGRYLGIEPLPDHASDLREILKRLELDGSVEEDEFSPDYPLSEVFDFVLFSHSLYWLPEPVLCVENALARLSPEGVLLAFLQAPMGIHNLFRLFDPLIERDAPVGPNHGYSSHELVVALREAGHQPRCEFVDSGFDLTGVFDGGPEADKNLNEMLSFALQIEFSELDDPLRSDVIDYLRAICVELDGRLVWREPTAAVLLKGSG